MLTCYACGARVNVKLEGTNPTGSFKDRGSAVGVTAALAAGRATGGVLAADDDIVAARDWMARAGMRVDPASATPLAGLGRLRDAGEVEAGEDVVLVATGAGYGDDAPPESVETVRREGLAGALRAD